MSMLLKFLREETNKSTRREFLRDIVKDISFLTGASFLSFLKGCTRPYLTQYIDGIFISGDPGFIKQVGDALSLLKDRDLETYKQIRRYVRDIKQYPCSGMDVYNQVYQVGNKTAFHSVEWLAGTIAHDSTHSKLFWDYKENNETPPLEVWSGQEAELKCLEVQARCLERIGAPEDMIKYVRSLDGTHYDIDQDGVYDSCKVRDW